ncbi:type II toxin-antitoxin system death-on-curing family toxin [Flavobacterium sp.]|jgi:death-on-curing protein|uniref:type II toxin-antitoxin system death-on-curing family toxin n=1 Tax=Flavobacterium sp. TaxID=239 RepID=UPI0037C04A5D
MISIKEVEIIHNILIDKFGGAKGIRDFGLLESALARPFATFDGADLYSSPIEKAAAIMESIVINHPFIDGNKRTAYTFMRLILLEYKLDIAATQEEKYKFVIAASKGDYKFEEIKSWIASNLKE